MFKTMSGYKEVLIQVEKVQGEFPIMRGFVADEMTNIRQDLKREVNGALSAMEMRVKKELASISAEIKKASVPDKFVQAIDKREEDKVREKTVRMIVSKLSEVYAAEREVVIYEKEPTRKGVNKLTDSGDKLYRMLSETVNSIAKLHGSKSHVRIANPATYKLFQEYIGESEELTKVPVYLKNGQARESVYADLLERRLVGKFVKYLEKEFVVSSE